MVRDAHMIMLGKEEVFLPSPPSLSFCTCHAGYFRIKMRLNFNEYFISVSPNNFLYISDTYIVIR